MSIMCKVINSIRFNYQYSIIVIYSVINAITYFKISHTFNFFDVSTCQADSVWAAVNLESIIYILKRNIIYSKRKIREALYMEEFRKEK